MYFFPAFLFLRMLVVTDCDGGVFACARLCPWGNTAVHVFITCTCNVCSHVHVTSS